MPIFIGSSLKKCFQYQLVEKLSIINKVKKAGWVNPISHQDGTTSCNVCCWLNQEQEIKSQLITKNAKKLYVLYWTKKVGHLTCMLLDNAEAELLEFYKKRCGKNLPVIVHLLYVKWAQLQPDLLQALSYNVAQIQLYWFTDWHNLSNCLATNQAQGLPTNQETIDDFVERIKDKIPLILGASVPHPNQSRQTGLQQ